MRRAAAAAKSGSRPQRVGVGDATAPPRRKSRQQVRHGSPKRRMAPLWRDLGQGRQNEPPLVHPCVRQCQVVENAYEAVHGDDVEVKRARFPARATRAPEAQLNCT